MDTAPRIASDALLHVAYAPRAARRRWLRPIVLIPIMGILLLAGGAYTVYSLRLVDRLWTTRTANDVIYAVRPLNLSIMLTENGELKPRNSVEVKCELEGQNTILWVVAESTQVKKGDLLVELASDAIKERLDAEQIELNRIESALIAAEQELDITLNENASLIRRGEIDVELAELELSRYLEGDFERSLKWANINIKRTEMDIERRKDDLDKHQRLHERGFVTEAQIEQLKFDLETAHMTLEQNQLEKKILLEYERPKNEKQKRSHLDQTVQELARNRQRATSRERQANARVEEQRALFEMRKKRFERLGEQYARCRVHAPVDGVVQYPSDGGFRWGEDRIAVGQKVNEGQTLIVLPDTSQMIVETRIHESDRHKVQEGAPCLVTVPAVPDRAFPGTIVRIARFADSTNRWLNPELREHTTEILLDPTDAPISPGDSAEVRILIDELRDVLAVPVQCVFTRGSKSYVFVRRTTSDECVEVAVGRASDSMIEVVAGLQAGDAVLLHVDERQQALLPAPATTDAFAGGRFDEAIHAPQTAGSPTASDAPDG